MWQYTSSLLSHVVSPVVPSSVVCGMSCDVCTYIQSEQQVLCVTLAKQAQSHLSTVKHEQTTT